MNSTQNWCIGLTRSDETATQRAAHQSLGSKLKDRRVAFAASSFCFSSSSCFILRRRSLISWLCKISAWTRPASTEPAARKDKTRRRSPSDAPDTGYSNLIASDSRSLRVLSSARFECPQSSSSSASSGGSVRVCQQARDDREEDKREGRQRGRGYLGLPQAFFEGLALFGQALDVRGEIAKSNDRLALLCRLCAGRVVKEAGAGGQLGQQHLRVSVVREQLRRRDEIRLFFHDARELGSVSRKQGDADSDVLPLPLQHLAHREHLRDSGAQHQRDRDLAALALQRVLEKRQKARFVQVDALRLAWQHAVARWEGQDGQLQLGAAHGHLQRRAHCSSVAPSRRSPR
eukprot:scaffold1166_cov261-Pinguiococcus_pyrenoidosus.AAC.6